MRTKIFLIVILSAIFYTKSFSQQKIILTATKMTDTITYQLDQQSAGSAITSVNSQSGPSITIAGANGITVAVSSNTVTLSSPYTVVYSDTTETTVTNTTTATTVLGNINGSTSFDGNSLTPGSILIQRGTGILTEDATPSNVEFRFTISNFTLALTISGLTGASTNIYDYEFEVTPFSLGIDHSIFYKATVNILDGTTYKRFSTNAKYDFFTTTGTLSTDVKIAWATANANNTVTSRSNTLEVKRLQ